MRTQKHEQKLADRRSEYADRRESRKLDRMIAEILAANPGMNPGEARRRASEARIAAAIAAWK